MSAPEEVEVAEAAIDALGWRDVQSSNVRRIHFQRGAEREDGETEGLLWVQFTNGQIYRYAGVPLTEARGLLAAHADPEQSVGMTYNQRIRGGGFTCEKVTVAKADA